MTSDQAVCMMNTIFDKKSKQMFSFIILRNKKMWKHENNASKLLIT